ncbi:brain acid soluble protein 1-like [Ambystoma mexicanum]|uniref:brain acid soluble protein 1-like n=1 Tax=Ambystoma mexicanum TaxID=8296 RepID=UPI0037E80836
MGDTECPTAVPQSQEEAGVLIEEPQATGEEAKTSPECTHLHGHDGGSCDDDKINKENVPVASTEDEGTEQEDLSTNKEEGSVLLENPYKEKQENAIEQEVLAHTEMAGCSTDVNLNPEEETASEKQESKHDQVLEKKLEIYLVEETVQLDCTPKEHVELSESGAEASSAGEGAVSPSEDHDPKEHCDETPEELHPSVIRDESPKAEKDNSQTSEEAPCPEHAGTEIPVITVETAAPTQSDHSAESVESSIPAHADEAAEPITSDTKDEPCSEKEHDECLHPTEGEADPLPEGSEQGSITETQQEPAKTTETQEVVQSSEDQGAAEIEETKTEDGGGSHADEHTQEVKEEKGAPDI